MAFTYARVGTRAHVFIYTYTTHTQKDEEVRLGYHGSATLLHLPPKLHLQGRKDGVPCGCWGLGPFLALVVCSHRQNWAREVKPKPLESWCFVPSEWRAVEVTWAGSNKSEGKGSSCIGSGV